MPLSGRDLRELAGIPAEPEITFLGQAYEIREDGFAPLLRFALTSAQLEEDESGLAVVYQLLEDCLTDFPAFARAAMDGKASAEDVQGAVRQLTGFYCARNHWPAMRLIGYVAASLDELDGQLLKATGRGVASLTAREACNLALATCTEGMPEEDRDVFLEDLSFEGDPDSDAMKMVRQMQADKAAREGGGG